MDEAEAAGDGEVDSIRLMEAVAIDNLDRTRSRGYVEHTEVMPANAPAASRFGVSNSPDPKEVKSFFSCS